VAKDTPTKCVVALLKETKGVYGICVGRAKRHPFVSWSMNGARFRYTCAGSPGDKRTIENCLAGVRRMVRVANRKRAGSSRSTSSANRSGCSSRAPS